MSRVLIPIAVSSQLDITGEERLHIAGYTQVDRNPYTPPVVLEWINILDYGDVTYEFWENGFKYGEGWEEDVEFQVNEDKSLQYVWQNPESYSEPELRIIPDFDTSNMFVRYRVKMDYGDLEDASVVGVRRSIIDEDDNETVLEESDSYIYEHDVGTGYQQYYPNPDMLSQTNWDYTYASAQPAEDDGTTRGQYIVEVLPNWPYSWTNIFESRTLTFAVLQSMYDPETSNTIYNIITTEAAELLGCDFSLEVDGTMRFSAPTDYEGWSYSLMVRGNILDESAFTKVTNVTITPATDYDIAYFTWGKEEDIFDPEIGYLEGQQECYVSVYEEPGVENPADPSSFMVYELTTETNLLLLMPTTYDEQTSAAAFKIEILQKPPE